MTKRKKPVEPKPANGQPEPSGLPLFLNSAELTVLIGMLNRASVPLKDAKVASSLVDKINALIQVIQAGQD